MSTSTYPVSSGPRSGKGWSVRCRATPRGLTLTIQDYHNHRIGKLKLPVISADSEALEVLLEALARCSGRRLHVNVRAVGARSVPTFEAVFIEQSPDFGSSRWLFVDWDVPEYGLQPARNAPNYWTEQEECCDF